MGQKRRRLALSCVACRKRKVKCGRELPSCVRCVRGAQDCKYVAYDDKSGNLLTPTDDSPEGRRDESDGEESWTEEANMYHRASKHGAQVAAAEATAVRMPATTGKRPVAPQRSLEQLQERVFELETYMRSAGAKPISSQMCKFFCYLACSFKSKHLLCGSALCCERHPWAWPDLPAYASDGSPSSHSGSPRLARCVCDTVNETLADSHDRHGTRPPRGPRHKESQG